MVETRDDAEAKRKVWDMIKDIEVAMLVSQDAEGDFRGRPMWMANREFDGVLWFYATAGTAVASPAPHKVLLAYVDPGSQNYVSVAGSAQVVEDKAKQKALWRESMRVWYPKGAEDPDIRLLKVTVEGAEYWDAPSSTLLHAYGYIKAVTTGQRPNPGGNAKVDFSAKG